MCSAEVGNVDPYIVNMNPIKLPLFKMLDVQQTYLLFCSSSSQFHVIKTSCLTYQALSYEIAGHTFGTCMYGPAGTLFSSIFLVYQDCVINPIIRSAPVGFFQLVPCLSISRDLSNQ